MFVILAIFSLGVLVFFHELGHFLMAKIFRVKVEEFGIGYPPRLGGFVHEGAKIKFFRGSKKNKTLSSSQTIYSLNLIPLGGFTKLKGETGEVDGPDSFSVQSWWKKALVAGGGALMNVFLAVLIFSFLCLVGIPRDLSQEDLNLVQVISEPQIQIGAVFAGSPAEQAGLEIGDILLTIDGQEFSQVEGVQDYIQRKVGQSIEIQYQRQDNIFHQVLPVLNYAEAFKEDSSTPILDADKGFIGVFLSQTALVKYPWYRALGQGFKMTFSLLGQIFSGIFLILKSLIIKQKMVGGVVGPVGITGMISDTARLGFVYLAHFVAILSVAIGAFQLIPFPALDGSRIVLSLLEGLRGRRLQSKTEGAIMAFGFYLLLTLLIVVSFREIVNLF